MWVSLPGNFSHVVSSFSILLRELKVKEHTKMELLGSPIQNDATSPCIMKTLSEHRRMSDRILLLDGHPDLFQLNNAFSFQRLLSTLRTTPCDHHPEFLAEYDEVTRSTTEAICNVHFDDNDWLQAKLPVRDGCLGLRTATDLALLDFLSHALLVTAWLTTSSISQRTRQRTTRKFDFGWTEISTRTSNGIGTIFTALQSSPPWFPYSTSIVWPVSRRLRVLRRAHG